VTAISLPGYTTAELSATRDLTGTKPFVVGDNATYGGYHNVLLTPDTVYVLYFVVAVAWDGVVKMAFSQLASAVRTAAEAVTSERPTTATDRSGRARQKATNSSNDDDQSTTVIVVSVTLFVLLVIGALAAIIIIYWRRRRNAGYHQRDDVIGRTGSDVTRRDVEESRQTSWKRYYSDHFDAASSRDDVTESVVADNHVTGNADKPRDLLVAYIASYKTVQFAEEFRQLLTTDKGPIGTEEATRSQRFLSGYRGRKRSYIVSAPPTDATAAFTYWAAIYQEGVTDIVSVGSSGAAVDATAYQPGEGEERKFGRVSVRTTVIRQLTHAMTVTFQIRRTDNDGLSRRVRQYEFTDWPIIDQAVPSTPLHFTEFVEVVRESSRRAQTGSSLAPLLVRRSTHDDTGNYHTFHFILLYFLTKGHSKTVRVVLHFAVLFMNVQFICIVICDMYCACVF